MKRTLISFLVVLFLFSLGFVGCSVENEEFSEVSRVENQISENSDSILIKLQAVNDSFINHVNCREETRGFRDWIRGIAIVAADIRGAIDGAKAGFVILQAAGAIVGAIIGGALYSTLAGIQYKAPSFDNAKVLASAERIELVYGNVRQDYEFLDEIKRIYSDVEIDIPQDHDDATKVGIMHNAILKRSIDSRSIECEKTILFTNTEQAFFDLSDFSRFVKTVEGDTSIIHTGMDPESDDITDAIICKFLSVLENYTQNMDDVNELVNSYIYAISTDPSLSYNEKMIVYSALSTAAYSASFWDKQIRSENILDIE